MSGNVDEDERIGGEVDEGATALQDTEIRELPREQSSKRDRELEWTRRKNALMKREIELMQRENEFLRRSAQATLPDSTGATETQRSERTPLNPNMTSMKEMLPVFDGKSASYRVWKEQLMIVKQTYHLDDNLMKLLLGMRLTGNAAEWFQSVPTHLTLNLDELLARMEAMYDRRESRLMSRKKFESKMWQRNETFTDYFHKKLILANKVPIDEAEIVDYIIDGIPDKAVKYQATMQQFLNKEEMLRAMQNIQCGSEAKTQHQTPKQPFVKGVKMAGSTKKTDGETAVVYR